MTDEMQTDEEATRDVLRARVWSAWTELVKRGELGSVEFVAELDELADFYDSKAVPEDEQCQFCSLPRYAVYESRNTGAQVCTTHASEMASGDWDGEIHTFEPVADDVELEVTDPAGGER